MRTKLLVTFGLTWLILGGGCLPLVDNTGREPAPGESLAIAIDDPTTNRAVVKGLPVLIEWSAANLTGDTATVSIIVESRSDLSRTTLVEGIELEGTGDTGTVTWDTEEFSGLYAIIGCIKTAELTREDTGAGLITVDARPTFEFTAPEGDVVFRPASDDPLTIAWTGSDETAIARIGLDPDTEHSSGNEVFLLERQLPGSGTEKSLSQREQPDAATGDLTEEDQEPTTVTEDPFGQTETPASSTEDSFAWDGTDADGTAVDFGTYNLFAIVTDDVNEALIVEGLGQITVAEAAEEEEEGEEEEEEEEEPAEGPAVTQPEEDTDFLATDDSFTIEYGVNQSADALVDVKIDTDDDHANGNEVTILSQQFVEADSDPDPFEWDGTGTAGDTVPDGIYRIFLVVNTGGGAPQTAEAPGLVYRRSTEDKPLIGLLAPASVTTVDPGDQVLIQWRDDDPGEEATIRIVLDTESDPAEGVGLHQTVILAGREAAPDDVQDTYYWQVPNSLDPGTYYVMAYINHEGEGNSSVAPAPVIVNDPANP